MTPFDPTKSYGEIFGVIQGCPGATFSQNGCVYNSSRFCLRDAKGNVLKPGADSAMTEPDESKEKSETSAATPEVETGPSEEETEARSELAKANAEYEEVPSTVKYTALQQAQLKLDTLIG